jgi:ubiquinone/menaquinone biosynthesis C-methylase UbiE
MNERDPYTDIAPFYDLEFDTFSDDVELYLGYAGMVGGPVLELGSGTGRLLLPLAEVGFECHGVDSSPDMNALARERFERAGISNQITLHEHDMADLSHFSPNTFRLVFAAINSLLHLESRRSQVAVLRAVRNVLDRDGLFIVDVFNPTPETLIRMDDRYAFDGTWQVDNGTRVERFSHRQVDSANQVIKTTLFYDVVSSDSTLRRHTTSYEMRYIHRFELEGLLSESGFELEGIYGSYQLDPIDASSHQIIAVAHRTPNPGEA